MIEVELKDFSHNLKISLNQRYWPDERMEVSMAFHSADVTSFCRFHADKLPEVIRALQQTYDKYKDAPPTP